MDGCRQETTSPDSLNTNVGSPPCSGLLLSVRIGLEAWQVPTMQGRITFCNGCRRLPLCSRLHLLFAFEIPVSQITRSQLGEALSNNDPPRMVVSASVLDWVQDSRLTRIRWARAALSGSMKAASFVPQFSLRKLLVPCNSREYSDLVSIRRL